MKSRAYLAADLGASNGRTILGRFDGAKLELEELTRFENNYVRVGETYYWDVLRLYTNIVDGLKKFGRANGGTLSGIGIDTWGVDFGLIDEQGKLIANPRAYRDPRNLEGMNAFLSRYGERFAFDRTGIANMEFNTSFQLYDMVRSGNPLLKAADKLLLLPDLLSYMLCGAKTCEYTHASTTQMLSGDGDWSREMSDAIGLKPSLLPSIQMSGEKKGDLYSFIRQEAGIKEPVPVYCVGSHDTASAVASVPAYTDSYAYISSGTWSLIGIEREKAVINDTVFKNSFSNEGTILGEVRMLRNIMGMWIIQNCKRQWDSQNKLSWDDIVSAAKTATPFKSFIDVTAQEFYSAGDMIGKIQDYCEKSGQPVPQTVGQISRTVYESLAMCYKEAFIDLEQLKQKRIDVLHIVGGGSNNKLLNQMTANALSRPVVAGPSEATATGNLMVQLKASGEVKDINEMRQVIRNSFNVETYEPRQIDEWEEQYLRYKRIKQIYKEF
jgi:rhamnulokinase